MKHIEKYIDNRLAMEVARSYNVLSPKIKLTKVVNSIAPEVDVSSSSKFELHKLINEIIISNYSSEQLMKSLLVDYFISENVISAFEIKANDSRLDFLRINGDSISYEIKSQVDNLSKLEKQSKSYTELFEYNYVVVSEIHYLKAREIVSKEFGIMVEESGTLVEKRKARKNTGIISEQQLKLFTKKELAYHFDDDINSILRKNSKRKINLEFKKMLKRRYQSKWEFLKKHKSDILPIDYQYFYHHNIEPSLIYGKR